MFGFYIVATISIIDGASILPTISTLNASNVHKRNALFQNGNESAPDNSISGITGLLIQVFGGFLQNMFNVNRMSPEAVTQGINLFSADNIRTNLLLTRRTLNWIQRFSVFVNGILPTPNLNGNGLNPLNLLKSKVAIYSTVGNGDSNVEASSVDTTNTSEQVLLDDQIPAQTEISNLDVSTTMTSTNSPQLIEKSSSTSTTTESTFKPIEIQGVPFSPANHDLLSMFVNRQPFRTAKKGVYPAHDAIKKDLNRGIEELPLESDTYFDRQEDNNVIDSFGKPVHHN